MARIEFDLRTDAPPEAVRAALLDFSEHWPVSRRTPHGYPPTRSSCSTNTKIFSHLETRFIDCLGTKSPVLIAGDDDQALYGFRHASADYIRELARDASAECHELPYCGAVHQIRDQALGVDPRPWLRAPIGLDAVCDTAHIVASRHGGPDVLTLIESELHDPRGPGEARMAVTAAGRL